MNLLLSSHIELKKEIQPNKTYNLQHWFRVLSDIIAGDIYLYTHRDINKEYGLFFNEWKIMIFRGFAHFFQ